MPVHPFWTNFTAGELSPLLYARTDLQKFASGAELIQNFIVMPQGGATRRAGTTYVAKTRKFGDQKSRLIPFIFNQDQAYVLEFCEGFIRFFIDRAPVRFADSEPAVTMTLGALTGAAVSATASGAIFTSNEVDVGREIIFDTGGRAIILSISSPTVATVCVLEDFTDLAATSGNWTLTGNVVEVATPYVETELFEIRFAQSADTLYVVHPNHAPRKLIRQAATTWTFDLMPFDPPPTVETGHVPDRSITLSAASGTAVTVTASAAAFSAADVNREIKSLDPGGGRGVITVFTNNTTVTIRVLDTFPDTAFASGDWMIEGSPITKAIVDKKEPAGALVTITADTDAFRTAAVGGHDDTGRFIRINGGLVQIIQVAPGGDHKVVIAQIKRALSLTPETRVIEPGNLTATITIEKSPAGSWTIEDPAGGDERGWPNVVTFHEQRLVFAGIKDDPARVWGSVSGDFENFAPGADDDDSYDFILAANQLNVIRWIASARRMMLGTVGGEFIMQGGADEPITPTNVLVQSESNHGSEFEPDALRIDEVVLFVERGGRKLREMKFDFDIDEYKGTDLTILAEHLTESGIKQIAYLRAAESVVLVAFKNGTMGAMTYERDENVVAWSRVVTQGSFESVVVVPNKCQTGDEVWVVVNRTVGGNPVRMIEIFDGFLAVDSAVVYFGPPVNRLQGLIHLEGKEVHIRADNNVYVTTVNDGAVDIPAPASFIQVGLSYLPVLVTARSEAFSQSGTAQGRRKHHNEVMVRIHCTDHIVVNGEDITEIMVDGVEDQQLIPISPGSRASGDIRREANLRWDRAGRVKIESLKPLPITVLGISPSMEVADD
jgi:hypothetical protein